MIFVLDFTLAPPFDSAININDEIGDTGGEHHRCFGAGAAHKDNCPDG